MRRALRAAWNPSESGGRGPASSVSSNGPVGEGGATGPTDGTGEIAYLRDSGVRMVISCMTTRHNLGDYEAAGLDWHHVPVVSTDRGSAALDELLPFLKRELRRAGAVAVHGKPPHRLRGGAGSGASAPRARDRPGRGPAAGGGGGAHGDAGVCALLGVDPEGVLPDWRYTVA